MPKSTSLTEKLKDLQQSLAEVDLLTKESIHNPYLRKSIESTKVLIYDGQREKISF
jgi:predicted nucleotidyltransferase